MSTIKFAEGVLERLREMNDLEIGSVARVLAMESPDAFAAYIPALRVARLTSAEIERDLRGHGCAWLERCADIGGCIRRALLGEPLTEKVRNSEKARNQVVATLRAQLDAAAQRAGLAEATLDSIRAAVAKRVEVKQDTRPKVGDMVPWSEMEDGLYHRPEYSYPFAMVVNGRVSVVDIEDKCVSQMLEGNNRGQLISAFDPEKVVFVARDLGTDPEAWRTAMREHMAKVAHIARVGLAVGT